MIDEKKFEKGISDILDDFRIICFNKARDNQTMTDGDYNYILGRLKVVIKMFWGEEE